MGKIKGWKKIKITHQPKPIRIGWKEGVWVTDKSKIEVNKIGNRYEAIRTFLGVTQGYTTYKTKANAMNSAYDYMRRHPRG